MPPDSSRSPTAPSSSAPSASVFRRLDPEQAREAINARQVLAAFRDAQEENRRLRGSMVWARQDGHEYLVHAAYDPSGKRKQRSLGRRSPETEDTKRRHDERKAAVADRLTGLREQLGRRAGVNRALGLGRVPLPAARIIRRLDRAGLLGHGARVLGTVAIHAYEAAAGAYLDDGLMATGDVDVLLDSRQRLVLALDEGFEPATLLDVIQKADRSYERSERLYRAVNRDGYMVDLIMPLRDPPFREQRASVGDDPDDLKASEIEGLVWHENARPFEATAIDTDGVPLRIVTSDPRDFAVHKLWLSTRADRDPAKRDRDRLQAEAVAALVSGRLPQLAFDPGAHRNFPKPVVEAAAGLFSRAQEGAGELDL